MKTIEKKAKKLNVNKETLRALIIDDKGLEQVAGGRKAGGSSTCDCF